MDAEREAQILDRFTRQTSEITLRHATVFVLADLTRELLDPDAMHLEKAIAAAHVHLNALEMLVDGVAESEVKYLEGLERMLEEEYDDDE